MPSIDSKAIVQEIIDGNGVYRGDPPIWRITRYTNYWGGISYGLDCTPDAAGYRKSEYVQDPVVVFEHKPDEV